MRKKVIFLISFVLPGIFSISAAAQSLPAPWQNTDIGSTGVQGFATYENGIFALYGSGTDIWGTADSFHYVYQSYTDNVQIIARLT